MTKSITILHAIRWAAEAWKKVLSDTLQKCFGKAGILTKNFEVVQPLVFSDEAHSLSDMDAGTEDAGSGSDIMDSELSDLISQLEGNENACSASDLVSAEEKFCLGSLSLHREPGIKEFWQNLAQKNKSPCQDEQNEDDLEPAPALPRVKSFREALTYLKDVHLFLECRGFTSETTAAYSVMDSLALHCLSHASTLTSITVYFF